VKRLNDALLEIILREKPPALMTHVVLGYPTLRDSIEIVRVMADSGAALIELQIPFSDPIGDGPTIMHANTVGLAQGVTPRDCMRAMRQLARSVQTPLLFMSYFNPILSYPGGVKGFCLEAAEAGAQGLIVADIPPEEKSDGYWSYAHEVGLAPIPLVSPVTSPARLRRIARATRGRGFVYCISTTAVTGAKSKLPVGLPDYLKKVRAAFDLPLALGFGISKPTHVRALRGHADIAIVGSATIDLISRTSRRDRLKKLASFVSRLS
jgi:tryptophan synthase alpha subunit